jgi:glycosyltransferase involved in cell wall biosynthesis
MHILFLTDNFPPEVNAPASRTFEHCREWVKAGCKVTVITGVPNFPIGRVYPGYVNRLWQAEEMGGIRVWTFIAANKKFTKRIIDYTSYMVSAILAAPCIRGADVVIATSPLLFTAMAGYVVGRLKRIPFVFELRDLWPESIKAVGAMGDSPVIRFFECIEMFLYRKADLIVALTHSFKERLVERKIPAEKIEIVTNGVDLTRF